MSGVHLSSGPRAGKLGPQSTIFGAPCFMKHRLDSEGFASLTVVYAGVAPPSRDPRHSRDCSLRMS